MARHPSAPFVYTMAEEERDLAAKLVRIGDHIQPIPLGELKVLSDLDPDDLAIFESEWPTFETGHRRSLAQALQEVGEESLELDFREVFITLLDDEDAHVRVVAARGLLEDTRRSTMRRLLRVLTNDADEAVRASAATSLGAWTLRIAEGDLDARASSEIEQALLVVYNDPATPNQVRQRLLETLGYLGNQPAIVSAIKTAAAHSNEDWQQSAICAMGHTGRSNWVTPISQALSSDNPAIRFEAARAAGNLAEVARPLLANLAKLVADRDVEIATAAIWSLGQIGGDAARRMLEQLVQDAQGARLDMATEALNELQFFDDPMGNIALTGDPDDDDDELDADAE